MTNSLIPAAAVSPLRQRLIADMTMRRFSKTLPLQAAQSTAHPDDWPLGVGLVSLAKFR